MNKNKGPVPKVYLVGAGPGDPGLLTLRAAEAIRRADVILYDRLVVEGTLSGAPGGAQKIYVGKVKGNSHRQQERIYRLILKFHREGKTVVRLKNGDPLLFGRGGEEIGFLRRHRIQFEVIPGISSAIGVPSNVGIPLTDRRLSSSLLIVPGHTMAGKAMDWAAAARFKGTLVVLMGSRNVRIICERLISGGMSPSTPACMIMRGSLKDQRLLRSTLGSLASQALRRRIGSPVVTIVGNVLKLSDPISR